MKGTVLIESFFDTGKIDISSDTCIVLISYGIVRTLMQEQNREFDIAIKYEQLLEQSGFQLLEKKRKTVQYGKILTSYIMYYLFMLTCALQLPMNHPVKTLL